MSEITTIVKTLHHIAQDKRMEKTVGDGTTQKRQVLLDATDLLEQQEKRIAMLEKDLGEEWEKRQIESHKAFQKQIELERELAAAKEDIHHNDACSVCIGAEQEVCKDCDCECLTCVLDCRCKDCRDESKWEWRGAREGEGK